MWSECKNRSQEENISLREIYSKWENFQYQGGGTLKIFFFSIRSYSVSYKTAFVANMEKVECLPPADLHFQNSTKVTFQI